MRPGFRDGERPDPFERVTGIEPAFSAWEADVLPLNYTRDRAEDTRPAGRPLVSAS
jgi:hypothetical protein